MGEGRMKRVWFFSSCIPRPSLVLSALSSVGHYQPRRSPRVRNGNALQYAWLENPMERGTWWATVRGVTKSRTRLSEHTRVLYLELSEDFPGGTMDSRPANAQVQSLAQEDPTCWGAAKPMCHKYWARVLQLLSPYTYIPCSATRDTTAMRSPHTAMKDSPCLPQREKTWAQQPKISKQINVGG